MDESNIIITSDSESNYEPEIKIETSDTEYETTDNENIHHEVIIKTEESEISDIDEKSLSRIRTKTVYACNFENCNRVFTRSDRLRFHQSLHTGERPYRCELCDKSYIRPEYLKRHHKTSHTPKEDSILIERCLHCDKQFTSTDSLKRHIKISHLDQNGKRFPCTICGRTFHKSLFLKGHMMKKHAIKPSSHECDICGKFFQIASKLKRHMETHNKKYMCTDCNEICENWTLLRKHRSINHPKVYNCKTCEKTFKNKKLWQIHENIHNETRKVYHCTYEDCPKYYYFERNVKQHIRSYHEGKRFACSSCGDKFTTKQKLEYHELRYHNIAMKLPLKKKKKKKDEESILKERKERKDKGIEKPKDMAAVLSSYATPSASTTSSSSVKQLDLEAIRSEMQTNTKIQKEITEGITDDEKEAADTVQICHRRFDINQTTKAYQHLKDCLIEGASSE